MTISININDLPVTVLNVVFELVYRQIVPSKNTSYFKRLSHFKPVTAVCRLWRPLALGLFYDTIVYEMYTSTGVRSNIEMIESGRHANLAKKIWLGLFNETDADLTAYYNKTLSALKQSSFGIISWPNVKRLEYCEGDSFCSIKKYRGDEAALFEYLSRHLPNLDSVVCHDLADVHDNVINLEEYFNVSPRNLKLLDISCEYQTINIRPEFHCLSRNLSYLRIVNQAGSLDRGSLLPSRIYAPSLRYLEFTINPELFNWGIFFDDIDDVDHIKFASLKELTLDFIEPDGNVDILDTEFARSITKCKFPALEALGFIIYFCKTSSLISLFSSKCPSLKILYLIPILKNETIFCGTESDFLASLESLSLANYINHVVDHNKSVIHNARNMPLVRHIRFNFNPECALPIYLPSDTSGWKNLRHFVINAYVDISTIPMFIASLKQLKIFELRLYNTESFRNESKQQLTVNPVKKTMQGPISTSLLTLKLALGQISSVDMIIVNYFTEIALSIPSLQKYAVPEDYFNETGRYIKAVASYRRFSPVLHDLQLNSTLFDLIKQEDLE